ncbi:MAG: response regulator [Dysgonamonadaceae bacterium]|jgi:signal transduction histidine kinase/DNA-binding response OmpR family regulator/ligand-binding sensor domain-containing protein|nr:response regulator [Dysgonamonadaceae bacterium]
MIKLRFVFFFGLFCFPWLGGGLVHSEELHFYHLTRSEGLLHDNVTCVAQDSIGYIWFGTHRGLNRYDGYSIDSYRYDNGKINSVYYNRVYKIEITGNFLWMATEAGIVCFDIYNKQYIDVAINDPGNLDFYSQVRYLKKGYDGLMWFFTDRNHIRLGEIHYDAGKNKCVVAPRKIGNEYGFVSQDNNPKVAFDETGNVWISGNDYISCYGRGSDGELYFAGCTEQRIGRDVKEMNYETGNLWIAYWDKIDKYHVSNSTEIEKTKSIPYSWRNISTFYLNENSIWLGSDNGILQITVKEDDGPLMVEHRHLPLDANSMGNAPNNIFLDRNNNIWVSTWGAGVAYANTNPKFFQTITYNPLQSKGTIASEFVSCIHKSSDGYVYLGTKFGGISRLKSKNKKDVEIFCTTSQLLPAVTSIHSDDETVFAAVNNTIVLIDKQSKHVKDLLHTARHVFWIEFDRFNRLWAATHAGLECFEKQNGQWKKTRTLTSASSFKLSTDLLHNIYSNKEKNELLVTSASGMNRIRFKENGDIQQVIHYRAKENDLNSLSSNFLWPIDRQNDSVYWIGSMGNGLNRLTLIDKPDGVYDYSCDVYGKESGAPSGDIESLAVDKYGNVWCGGFSLACFDTKLNRFNVFDINDGLQSYMFGTSSSCKDSDGTLYFGGAKGMNYFMPAPNMMDSNAYPVFFSRVYINGKLVDSDIEYSKSLTLKYPDNNFTLDFTSLLFNTGQHIRYRYRLDDYDSEWRYIEMGKEPKVSYQKLPYGNYQLMVESGGWKDWRGNHSILNLYVPPPFWWSWYAKTTYLLMGLGIVFLLFNSFLHWMQMKQIISLQTERERFFTDVSHEFKTPLSIINSAIAELNEEETAVQGNKHFTLIQRNNNKLLKLINELLDFHRADGEKAHLKTTCTSVRDFIMQIYDEFSAWSASSGISMRLSLPEEDIRLWLDEERLGKIITNILSNSIRYTESGGTIDVNVSTGNVRDVIPYYESSFRSLDSLIYNNHLIINVRDTGVGIPPASLPLIFERFYQVNTKPGQRLGSGIGLALVHSLVRLHHGGIILSSKMNEGTEMIVALPLDDGYLRKNEKVDESSFELGVYLSDYALEYEQLEWDNRTEEAMENKPTLLLVDDNQEILMILREHFKNNYNTILAFDGEEAFQKCNTQFPDLVISDVMMPKMNGIELCANLKKHLRTCFIPVILLSAKSLVEHQIEGVESGADAYIPKPFDIRLLKATVQNLLTRSGQLKDFNPAKAIINRRKEILDEKRQAFFLQLTGLVEANMNNPHFSIDHLCLELGMNRSKLYSTIKEITGMTLGHYILQLRLDKAGELLKTTDITVTETCYRVGIDSPSYFSKAFKAQFGVSPIEFAKTENVS